MNPHFSRFNARSFPLTHLENCFPDSMLFRQYASTSKVLLFEPEPDGQVLNQYT